MLLISGESRTEDVADKRDCMWAAAQRTSVAPSEITDIVVTQGPGRG